jgi:O-antigen/teichoic acid export membrane protein
MISLKVFFKEVFLYTISKIAPGISGLASVVLFVRIVGVEEYGSFSYLLSQCYLIAAFGFGWLNQSQLRYYNKDYIFKEYNGGQIRAFIYSSIICLIILLFFSVIQPHSIIIFVIAFISILGIGGFNYIKTFYQARLLPVKILWISLIQSTSSLILPLLFLTFFTKNSNTILLGVGASFITIILFFIIIKVKIKTLINDLRYNGKIYLKKWALYGSSLSIWFAAGLALPFLDRFFINKYLSHEDLGIYSSVQEILFKVFSLIIFPLTMAIHPRIMNSWNESKKNDSFNLIKFGILIVSTLGIILFSLLLYFDSFIFGLLNILIPEFKIENKQIILPLISAGFLWQLSFLTHKIMELNEKTNLMVLFISISLLINIFGNIYFIPLYGIISTSFVSFISAFIYCLLTGSYSIYSIINSKKL